MLYTITCIIIINYYFVVFTSHFFITTQTTEKNTYRLQTMQRFLVIFLGRLFLFLRFAFNSLLFLLLLLGICILSVNSELQTTNYFRQLIVSIIIICAFLRSQAIRFTLGTCEKKQQRFLTNKCTTQGGCIINNKHTGLLCAYIYKLKACFLKTVSTFAQLLDKC